MRAPGLVFCDRHRQIALVTPMVHKLPFEKIGPAFAGEPVCIVLDNGRPTAEQRRSFVFTRPRKIFRCDSLHEVRPLLASVSDVQKNTWVAGYLAYEAGIAFEEKLFGSCRQKTFPFDLAWFGVFDMPYIFDHGDGAWNRPLPSVKKLRLERVSGVHATPKISHRISKKRYSSALSPIRQYIAAGDVYQVNFTYDVSFASPLRAWDLYGQIRCEQPVAFGAFIKTPRLTVASFSPELFFMTRGEKIIVRPMKGTAPRGRFTLEDGKISRDLARDRKNRSENIMIVDLLRNDLGKICRIGSVKTTKLFAVERHPTLHQMTSTVQGTLRKNTRFADILAALFPSGSVTGAPKIRAMEIIRDLERGSRGAYCGTIGYCAPDGGVWSVPIRTLQRRLREKQWQYRVGSGVVWDSSASGEWLECATKCDFLTAGKEAFRIFESILFCKGRFRFLRGHERRLFDSARYFDFPADRAVWARTVAGIKQRLNRNGGAFKVRIFLDKDGLFSWDREPLAPAGETGTARALLSFAKIDPANPFLFHKTTRRSWYDKAMAQVRSTNIFDAIHVNNRGEITEGGRSNVFVKIRGVLYTPPMTCGLLPGVLRERFLASGKCKERVLYPADLYAAQEIFCGNSVRGLVKIKLVSG